MDMVIEGRRCVHAERVGHERIGAGIDVEIFGLGRPVPRELGFDTATGGPACSRGCGSRGCEERGEGDRGDVSAKGIGGVDERSAAGDVQQRRAGEIAGARAQGGVPIGLLSDGDDVIVFLEGPVETEITDIAFNADEEVRTNFAIIARRDARRELVVIDIDLADAGSGLVHGVREDRGSNAGLADGVAVITADIKTIPEIVDWRRCSERLDRHVGGVSNTNKRDQRDAAQK